MTPLLTTQQIKREMETTLFCVFSHFLCDLFEELASLSLTLQGNDLILPQATTALKKTVTSQEALKTEPKPGGLLEKILTAFAQQQGDEMRFQVCLGQVNVLCLKEYGRHLKRSELVYLMHRRRVRLSMREIHTTQQ